MVLPPCSSSGSSKMLSLVLGIMYICFHILWLCTCWNVVTPSVNVLEAVTDHWGTKGQASVSADKAWPWTPIHDFLRSFNPLVNKGFWFRVPGIQLSPGARLKWIRSPVFSHAVDFSMSTFRETQGELPSEASDYCIVCLFYCLLMHVVMYLFFFFYYKYIWP